jgi:hypothetical protein
VLGGLDTLGSLKGLISEILSGKPGSADSKVHAWATLLQINIRGLGTGLFELNKIVSEVNHAVDGREVDNVIESSKVNCVDNLSSKEICMSDLKLTVRHISIHRGMHRGTARKRTNDQVCDDLQGLICVEVISLQNEARLGTNGVLFSYVVIKNKNTKKPQSQ